MPFLHREEALAFDDRYAEFQEGRVIIHVDFPPGGNRGEWLARASTTFNLLWEDLPKIVAFARTHLRSRQLARWRQYDFAGVSANALTAYGIWIDPTDGTSTCHVSYNWESRMPPGLPELTEDDWVMVERSATGWLTVGSSRHSDGTTRPPPLPLRCPCCYCKTLKRRGVHAICPVCFWEDDGQDDHDADVVTGGPNYELSLTQARANYAEFGASRSKDLPHVRVARPEELPGRD